MKRGEARELLVKAALVMVAAACSSPALVEPITTTAIPSGTDSTTSSAPVFVPALFDYDPSRGETTYDLERSYEDNTLRAEWKLDRFFLEADWIAIVDVLTIGEERWNSMEDSWWYVGPEDPGPYPELGRDVEVRLFAAIKSFEQGVLEIPAEGDTFTIYVPGGDRAVDISDDVWEKLTASYTVEEDSNEGSAPKVPNPGTLVISFRPKAALTEGIRYLILLEEEDLIFRDGSAHPKIMPMVSADDTQFEVDPSSQMFVNRVSGAQWQAAEIYEALVLAADLGGPAAYYLETFVDLAGLP